MLKIENTFRQLNKCKLLIWAFIFTFSSLWVAPSVAQQKLFQFQHIDPAESFASSDILSMTQDQQGFLWFASLAGGFARYDGYEFKIYRHDPGDRNSLPTNSVSTVYADPLGGIWAGTADGLVWLDTELDRLTIYRNDPADPRSLSDSYVSPILRDSRGMLWVGTRKGLNRSAPGTDGFTRYPLTLANPDPVDFLPSDWVWSLFEDSSGTLWAGTLSGGLLRYDRDSDTFERFLNKQDDPESLPGNVVRTITEDRHGDIWVGTDHGMARMVDPKSGRFEIFRTQQMFPDRDNNNVDVILEDRYGNLWASLGRGDAVIVRPEGSSSFEFLEHDPSDPGSLGRGRVWSIFESDSGILWMLSDVISRLVPTVHAFALFPKVAPSVQTGNLLFDSRHRLWLGGGDGLHGYDFGTGNWTDFLPFPGEGETANNRVDGAGIYEDSDHVIWVSTDRRLNRFDPETGNFDPADIPQTPNCIFKGSDGLIWLCVPFTGLVSYDFEARQLNVFSHDDADPESVSFDFGYTILEDSRRQLWYGTHDGLNLFDRETHKAKRFFSDREDLNSLSNSSIRILFEDSKSQLWIGTEFGLNLLDNDSFEFSRFYNGMAAPDNVIQSIVSLGDGYLWIATDRGIARFEPESGRFINFSYSDGLPSNFIPSLQAGQGGELYALSTAGVLQIDTNLLKPDSKSPPLAFTDLRIFNEPVPVSTAAAPSPLDVGIDQLSKLELSHSDQIFSLTFAALDYWNPPLNRYQYRLEGLNEKWIDTDASRRVAAFTDLSPGNYQLHIRGSNKDGVWNEAGVSLAINVLPPLWRTWWAYALYAIAFLLLLTGFVQWRMRLLRVHSSELEQAVEDRTHQLIESEQTVRHQADSLQDLLVLKERLFTNISHEFRTPLTLMLGPIENAMKEVVRPEVIAQLQMARRNGKRVLRLVDQLLELSRLSSEEPLALSPQPLKPIVELVTEAFRPYAREKGISLTVTTDDELWANCATDAIERMLMNLVSNAIKFTPEGGRVNVTLREREKSGDANREIELVVFDTGKGIPHDKQGTIFERFKRADDFGEAVPGSGIGLALVKELAEAHCGSITLESGPGKGTVFTVVLPRHEVKGGVQVKSDAMPSEALRLEIETLEHPRPAIATDEKNEDGGKPLVLIIEDNRDMQVYLHQMLSSHYHVELAGDGEIGLTLAREQIPDIVICDVMLPKKDGYEISHELKSDGRTSHIPIIMLTARSDEDSKLEGLRERVDDFLVKPFNDEELMLRIANLLAIRDILKARYSGKLHTGSDPRDSLSEPERRFLGRLETLIEHHHSEQNFSVMELAAGMAMSVRQLQRKLKAVTDQQPIHYLRLYRLERSLDLLKMGKRVGDVAFAVGFGSPAHFASCFRAHYGCTPTEYQAQQVNSGSGQFQ